MTNLYGVDYGLKRECRICKSDLFLVEIGTGTINDKPIGVMTIRCHRCATVMEQLQIDWQASAGDKVMVEDGVKRG